MDLDEDIMMSVTTMGLHKSLHILQIKSALETC